MPQTVFVGLGSNKSWHGHDPAQLVQMASKSLAALGETVELSPLYSSPAWPDPSQPPYTNAVARLASGRPPEALLEGLLAIEAGFGRLRYDDPARRYAPRALDLDLLAVGSEVRATARLTLPHPRMAERDFVLLPWRDLDPEWRHPVTSDGLGAMLDALPEISAEKL